MTAIIEIEGIGDVYAAQLQEAGIRSVEALLKQCATPQGRKELAKTTDISNQLILKWANRADLFRIKGIGTQSSDLLKQQASTRCLSLPNVIRSIYIKQWFQPMKSSHWRADYLQKVRWRIGLVRPKHFLA